MGRNNVRKEKIRYITANPEKFRCGTNSATRKSKIAAEKKFSGRSPRSSQYMPPHVPARAAMKPTRQRMPAASSKRNLHVYDRRSANAAQTIKALSDEVILKICPSIVI